MKTLEEHEAEQPIWTPPATERANDIACPVCGIAMFDDLTVALASLPPRTRIFCKKGHYTGSRR